MRHKVATVKFKYGKDANSMLLRKLLKNFIRTGTMQTSQQKAKFMRASLDRMVNYAKRDSEAAKNQLLKALGDDSLVTLLRKEISPVFKDRTSGFTTIVKLGQRNSDGASLVKISWVSPVVLEKKAEPEKIKVKNQKLDVKSSEQTSKVSSKKQGKK